MGLDDILDRHNRQLHGSEASKDASIIDIGASAPTADHPVTFLHSLDWKMVDAERIHKRDPQLAEWNIVRIYSKDAVNGISSSPVIRRSYEKLRTDFLSGAYYRLDFTATVNYAYVLMFEFLALYRAGQISCEKIANIKDVLVSCCPVVCDYFENQIRLLTNGGGNLISTSTVGYYGVSYLSKFSWNHMIDLSMVKFSHKEMPAYPNLYIVSKQHLLQQGTSIRRTYMEIREDFFKGILYNLNDSNYSGYAYVLMYDILDCIRRQNRCTLEQVINISGALSLCCRGLSKDFRSSIYQVYKTDSAKERLKFMDYFKINYQYNWALVAYKQQLISEEQANVLFNDIDWYMPLRRDEQPDLWATFIRYYANVMSPMGRKSYEDIDSYHLRAVKFMCFYQLCEHIVPQKFLLRSMEMLTQLSNYKYFSTALNKTTGYDISKHIEDELEPLLPTLPLVAADITYKFNQYWKEVYATIVDDYQLTDNLAEYWQKVDDLLQKNRKCSNLNMLYAAIVKDTYQTDASKARVYYIKGCLQCQRLVKIGIKIVGKLFGKDRYDEFTDIIDRYVTDHDVAKAKAAIADLFTVKAKTLAIDTSVIASKAAQQQQTADMLAEILRQEDAEEPAETLIEPAEEAPVEVEPAPAEEAPKAEGATLEAPVLAEGAVAFSEHQQDLLNYFVQHGYRCACDEVLDYIQGFGEFGELFIDTLNELCYDILDDNLIEQEDDEYVINEDYYHKLLG